ncbi:MAG TPA: SURF1 family cytochrome oxidase biogenesis protein [Caulobacteraceae bacterium]|nr:SURF1 family cytochrome oxidase biogenesis protein [Caulobacteraceae bacterium]
MRRIPVGPTIVVALAALVLIGLGAWQLQRLRWKEALLARVAALAHAPPRPIAPVLRAAARGADVAYTRVEATCVPSPRPAPSAYRYAIRDAGTAWRVLTICRLDAGPFDSILLDRGVADVSRGAMTPPPVVRWPEPGEAVGVLEPLGSSPWLGGETMSGGKGVEAIRVLDRQALRAIAVASGAHAPAPLFLAVEREDPPLAGVTPAALPASIPNNHFGYALTWFGLAIALVWIYVARLATRGA